MKLSARTGAQTYAFGKSDVEFKALLEHPDERVQAVVAARLGVKSTLEETRTEAFIGIAERGPLPIMLNYYGAHTGRASGGDKVNLQNLPRGGTLRHAIRAPEGHTLVAVDSSQIEARVVAWFAGQVDLVEDFRNDVDIYSAFATEVYGRPVNRKRKEVGPDGKEHKPDEVPGFVGKTCILGLGYGMGKDKFKATLKIGQAGVSVDMPIDDCERVVNLYRGKYGKIAALWKQAQAALEAMARGHEFYLGVGIQLKCDAEGIHLPNKMLIRYPELHKDSSGQFVYKTRYGFNKIYGGKVVENVVQSLARIIVFNQMAQIHQYFASICNKETICKVVLTVHDEVVACVPSGMAAGVHAKMERIMSAPPGWCKDLPIACEGSFGQTYGACK